MDLAGLSVKRPIFITSLVLLSLGLGFLALSRLGVDLFPDVTFPVVTVTTRFPGSGPLEVETLISKPIEDELSTLSGIKRLSSENREGVSIVIAEFTLETDVKFAEQEVRDRVGAAKVKFPTDTKESTIARLDPADQPILQLALKADLPAAKLYDLANDRLLPMLEQVPRVGKVEIIGGRKREIRVSLDRQKLKDRELSASEVVGRLAGAGEDVPSGNKSQGATEMVFRTLGQFKAVDEIRSLVVSFFGNDVPVRIGDVAKVEDTLEDERTRAYVNGEKSLMINAYKQSGANTVKVTDDLVKHVKSINEKIKLQAGHPELVITRNGALYIKANIQDVKESIQMGVLLAVIVVYLFLANFRSTIITGLALPNSLIGAFILMWIAGYTINLMTLLALTLSVGLLVDDAIVVRENIFRHIEMGKTGVKAALDGTAEVRMAVIATTLTVIAVFGPLGFLSGVVGQFFKQFGLTIVFAMFISLFDALTIAPMLSAFFAGHAHKEKKKGLYGRTVGAFLESFSRGQDRLENAYERLLKKVVRHPLMTLSLSLVVFVVCMGFIKFVPKTFLPPQDSGEFAVQLDLPPGTSLEGMAQLALEVDQVIRKNKEVAVSALSVGTETGDPNQASFYVHLVDFHDRSMNTSQFKAKLREELKVFAKANPVVKDFDPVGAGQRPFTLNILGPDQQVLETFAYKLKDRLKDHPDLLDVDVNFRPSKPEFQIQPDLNKAQLLGINPASIGGELRIQVEGATPAKYRENGIEYDVRVRMKEEQRDLKKAYHEIYVPNMNNSLVRLDHVSQGIQTGGPAKVTRQDRTRYVQINADIRPGGGLGNAMESITQILKTELKPPEGYEYKFVGQGENFEELGDSIVVAMAAGTLFIFLVLASLYESFVTPLTIMLAMPLAICGSFVALAVTGESLNIFSMIGLVMLLGVAVKNSILLVDYASQQIREGMDRNAAIVRAGKVRLRPILMTSMALIAGTLPIALGLNEASKQRTSMGVGIIGGLVSSTLLTLVVVPAAFSYIDRFRVWCKNTLGSWFIVNYQKSDS